MISNPVASESLVGARQGRNCAGDKAYFSLSPYYYGLLVKRAAIFAARLTN
ncbi:hypothetical protein [Microseira wollei]|uniref:Uncharacterized protein n=1 Tax=Microseira wollei NIES-4236 TaxID=2530354 RepID=A0AAV3X4X1_9CYAN|nr:hypothetical protein [Microseira wollei]GET36276.1 hypothetical protein MiSe_10240 [Microseira wollei NIES-4236]